MKKDSRFDIVGSITHFLFICFFIYVFGYLIVGEFTLEKEDFGETDFCVQYKGDWYLVTEEGDIPQSVPGVITEDNTREMTLKTNLPNNIDDDLYLCFRSAKQDMRISIDGQLRKEYTTKDTRFVGRYSPVAYVFVKIRPVDAGKELTWTVQTDSSYAGIFYDVYAGSQFEIWQMFFREYGVELIVALLIITFSIACIFGSVLATILYRKRVHLLYLSFSGLFAGVWVITNSVFRQLLFPNLSVASDVAFYMIMLLPLSFMLYTDTIQRHRYHKFYLLFELVAIIDFIICTYLHVSNIYDFDKLSYYMAGTCFISIACMGTTILVDFLKNRIKSYRYVAIGMLCAFICACMQIGMYYFKTIMFNGALIAIGLMLLLFFAIVNTIHDIIASEKEKQSALYASEAKGRFLANMSHEIRTPINAVIGLNTMIIKESKEPVIREYAEDVQNAGQTLLTLINDILDLSKIESGQMDIVPVDYNLKSLLYDVVTMISIKAMSKGLDVNLIADKNLPTGLNGDDVRIRQVLVNILNNAVKYTNEGHINLYVNGVTEDDRIKITFAVEDTGMGIKEEDMERLFTAFQRIDEKNNRSIEGTGLGMNITSQLLQLMGSEIKVESEYGKGSTFSFEIEQNVINTEPIGTVDEIMAKRNDRYIDDEPLYAPSARILVVDDNAINRKVFVNLLKGSGAQIDEAPSGEECLSLLNQNNYDLLFLDHLMPNMDGIETLELVRKLDNDNAHICAIVLTANAIVGAKEMYFEAGFDDYLSKPIDPILLKRMLFKRLPEELLEDVPGIGAEENMEEEDTDILMSKFTEMAEEMPKVDGIDWRYAMLRMNDKEILNFVIEQFCEEAKKESANLRDFYDELIRIQFDKVDEEEAMQKGYSNYRTQVHSMKSTALTIGALEVGSLAKLLEYAAKDKDFERIMNMTKTLICEWDMLAKRLDKAMKNRKKQKV